MQTASRKLTLSTHSQAFTLTTIIAHGLIKGLHNTPAIIMQQAPASRNPPKS